jgi:hypothetical protein
MFVEIGRRLEQMLAYPRFKHQRIAAVPIGHFAMLMIRDMPLRTRSVSLFSDCTVKIASRNLSVFVQ